MYTPGSFAVSDEKVLEAFIERYDFATLTSSSPSGLVTCSPAARRMIGLFTSADAGPSLQHTPAACFRPVTKCRGSTDDCVPAANKRAGTAAPAER